MPAEVLARAATTSHAHVAAGRPAGWELGEEPKKRPLTPAQRRREWRRTFVFAAVAFVVMVGFVVRDDANSDVEPYTETAIDLPPFDSIGPPRHDAANQLSLEVLERDGDRVTVAGWAAGTDRVELVADGQVIERIPVRFERPDTAIANDLPTAFVGFEAEVRVPAEAQTICVTRPGQLPGLEACNRTQLDMATQRIVAFYGVPFEPPLGTLGEGSAASVLERLVEQAEPYDSAARPVMHVFEVIATVAQAGPGSDGNYSAAIGKDDIWEFIEEIRAIGGHTVIDFQTGRDMYLDQVPDYIEFLREPDIHIALDPEWDMEEGEVPNEVIGSSDAEEINDVMEYVAEIIRENRLPRKVMVVHNFTEGMIANRDLLDPPPEIDLVVHMDGHGPPQNKIGVYDRLASRDFFNGFKLFYQRDFPLMTPEQVLALDPDFISYQ